MPDLSTLAIVIPRSLSVVPNKPVSILLGMEMLPISVFSVSVVLPTEFLKEPEGKFIVKDFISGMKGIASKVFLPAEKIFFALSFKSTSILPLLLSYLTGSMHSTPPVIFAL